MKRNFRGARRARAAVLGSTWRSCPFLIAALSLPIFAATLKAMRELAPTRLRLAGTAAGFAAGALIGPRVLRW